MPLASNGGRDHHVAVRTSSWTHWSVSLLGFFLGRGFHYRPGSAARPPKKHGPGPALAAAARLPIFRGRQRGQGQARGESKRALEANPPLNYLWRPPLAPGCQGTHKRVFASEPPQTPHTRPATHCRGHSTAWNSLGVQWRRLGSRLLLGGVGMGP
jgi:hypothetical protein